MARARPASTSNPRPRSAAPTRAASRRPGAGRLARRTSWPPIVTCRTPPADALHRALWRDRHLYLPNNLSFKMDIALGAFGLEGRAPFPRPPHSRMGADSAFETLGPRPRQRKFCCARLIATGCPKRCSPAKHGFGAPTDRWLAGPLAGAMKRASPLPLARPEIARELLRTEAVDPAHLRPLGPDLERTLVIQAW